MVKVQNYSLHGENSLQGLSKFFRYTLPLVLYSPISYFLMFLNSKTNKKKEFKYKFSLCLIFKDEEKYLKEWIEYHKLIGVDHFYLYNNNSSDNFREVLKPYIEENIVTLIDFPEQFAQVKAYKDCYERTKNETEWLGYIDADEYINLIKFDNIRDLLKTVDKFPSVFLNWRVFGTSGHVNENYEELTIERYTQTWENLSTTGKGFIHNTYGNHDVSVHFHNTKYKGLPVLGALANKSLFKTTHSIRTSNIGAIAYLNHYWSRSYEFYIFKDYVRGSAASKKNSILRQDKGRFKLSELKNKTKDFSIQRWLIFLKERMLANKPD